MEVKTDKIQDIKTQETKANENFSDEVTKNNTEPTSDKEKNLYKFIGELKNHIDFLKNQNMRLQKELSHGNENGDDLFVSEKELQKLVGERDEYKKIALNYIKKEIFETIKGSFNNVKYKNFDELPEEFHKLVCANVSPTVAYRAIISQNSQNEVDEMGAVNESSEREKDFYTPTEVDKLTKKQLANSKIMNTVMKSMLKW